MWKTSPSPGPDEAAINRLLPRELLLRIFSFLDVVTLCRCAQVRAALFCGILYWVAGEQGLEHPGSGRLQLAAGRPVRVPGGKLHELQFGCSACGAGPSSDLAGLAPAHTHYEKCLKKPELITRTGGDIYELCLLAAAGKRSSE